MHRLRGGSSGGHADRVAVSELKVHGTAWGNSGIERAEFQTWVLVLHSTTNHGCTYRLLHSVVADARMHKQAEAEGGSKPREDKLHRPETARGQITLRRVQRTLLLYQSVCEYVRT